MRVAKWGESLAIRLPADLIEALKLKEGDDIEIQVVGERTLEIQRPSSSTALLSQLRKFRGRLPDDFTFDRLEAHEHR